MTMAEVRQGISTFWDYIIGGAGSGSDSGEILHRAAASVGSALEAINNQNATEIAAAVTGTPVDATPEQLAEKIRALRAWGVEHLGGAPPQVQAAFQKVVERVDAAVDIAEQANETSTAFKNITEIAQELNIPTDSLGADVQTTFQQLLAGHNDTCPASAQRFVDFKTLSNAIKAKGMNSAVDINAFKELVTGQTDIRVANEKFQQLLNAGEKVLQQVQATKAPVLGVCEREAIDVLAILQGVQMPPSANVIDNSLANTHVVLTPEQKATPTLEVVQQGEEFFRTAMTIDPANLPSLDIGGKWNAFVQWWSGALAPVYTETLQVSPPAVQRAVVNHALTFTNPGVAPGPVTVVGVVDHIIKLDNLRTVFLNDPNKLADLDRVINMQVGALVFAIRNHAIKTSPDQKQLTFNSPEELANQVAALTVHGGASQDSSFANELKRYIMLELFKAQMPLTETAKTSVIVTLTKNEPAKLPEVLLRGPPPEKVVINPTPEKAVQVNTTNISQELLDVLTAPAGASVPTPEVNFVIVQNSALSQDSALPVPGEQPEVNTFSDWLGGGVKTVGDFGSQWTAVNARFFRKAANNLNEAVTQFFGRTTAEIAEAQRELNRIPLQLPASPEAQQIAQNIGIINAIIGINQTPLPDARISEALQTLNITSNIGAGLQAAFTNSSSDGCMKDAAPLNLSTLYSLIGGVNATEAVALAKNITGQNDTATAVAALGDLVAQGQARRSHNESIGFYNSTPCDNVINESVAVLEKIQRRLHPVPGMQLVDTFSGTHVIFDNDKFLALPSPETDQYIGEFNRILEEFHTTKAIKNTSALPAVISRAYESALTYFGPLYSSRFANTSYQNQTDLVDNAIVRTGQEGSNSTMSNLVEHIITLNNLTTQVRDNPNASRLLNNLTLFNIDALRFVSLNHTMPLSPEVNRFNISDPNLLAVQVHNVAPNVSALVQNFTAAPNLANDLSLMVVLNAIPNEVIPQVFSDKEISHLAEMCGARSSADSKALVVVNPSAVDKVRYDICKRVTDISARKIDLYPPINLPPIVERPYYPPIIDGSPGEPVVPVPVKP